MKKLSLLLIFPILLSSCATILNGTYQKVTVNKKEGSKLIVNGVEPEFKDGRYKIKRNKQPQQVVVSKEGYKDEYYTLFAYKKSPLYIMSWIPFGVTLVAPMYDFGAKSWNYDKEITINSDMVSIDDKEEDAKEIRLNNFGVNLSSEQIKVNYYSNYKNFLRGWGKTISASEGDVETKVETENTIFSDVLNEMLLEKGYIDTTRKVFKDNYLDNLLIDAAITDCKINVIGNGTFYSTQGMVYINLSVEWKALDYYKNPVFEYTTNTTSGQFAVRNFNEKDYTLEIAIKDAIEYGFNDFMHTTEVKKLLKDKTQEIVEAAYDEIKIPVAQKYVSKLSEATTASVTVKVDEGHGSGFVISPEGHIITNYHVIANAKNIKVVLSDEKKYDVEVIRTSKIHDLALLKIDAKDLMSFKISDDKNIELATEIYAVGTPSAEDLSQTISRGIISGLRKNGENSKLIQTDASINAGNSGGAILNKDGLVLGVVASKLRGFGIEGVAFGIPAYEIFDKLKISYDNKEHSVGGR
ncbi:S1C family serine protease [Chondrinema litorale]|uniref:S1C family serine protease n=1 Tax=Chondrinema litorale TaxID=2994555 RepID=UPI002543A50E|nr:trypsin-like peptidase domain-containing protein [Chondrinema litorale]UZR93472.1 trypsin-like peptidase domain-containing protein [Chondrinema litorale]